MPSDPSGSQRSSAGSNGRSFAQLVGAILRKQAQGQNPDKDEVPGSSPGRPTTHRRRSERCRQRAGRARCRLGPRWGRTPIPAGTSSGPSGAAHPGVRLGHDHPPWSRPQPEDGSHAACGHLALRLLPCPPRRRPRRRGPPPTQRPESATDLPLTNATAAASPASRPPGPSSSRRRPGSHRFLGSGSPGHGDLVPNATA